MYEISDADSQSIRRELRGCGWSMVALERQCNLPPNTLVKTLRKPDFAGELTIAEAIQLSPRQIWPNRYYEGGDIPPQDLCPIIQAQAKLSNKLAAQIISDIKI